MTTKTTFKLAAVAFAACLTLPTAQAQVEQKTTFNIPFAYAAASKTLPAGAYVVSTNRQSGVVTLRKTDNSAAIMVIGTAIGGGLQATEKSILKFHKYGDAYFLSEVWDQGHSMGVQLRPSPAEKELAARASENVVLSAKR